MSLASHELLRLHLEYTEWAMQKTFAFLDTLPDEVLTRHFNSSFPSILATVQHIYRGDKYFLIIMARRLSEVRVD